MTPADPLTCLGPAREAFVRGARLFDAGAFFAAHEAWEERWLVEPDPGLGRTLQGFIQVAAGFHKLFERKSPESAARLLERGLAKLDAEEGTFVSFREGVRALAGALVRGERVGVEAVPKIGSGQR